jgi:plasmid stabilization system protein ParE
VNVALLEVARQELDEAVSYYNSQSPGLGDAFALEIVAAIDRICRFPEAWHPLGDETRRCRLRRFPYGVIYAKDESGILILAIAHMHRQPDYWRDRLKS